MIKKYAVRIIIIGVVVVLAVFAAPVFQQLVAGLIGFCMRLSGG